MLLIKKCIEFSITDYRIMNFRDLEYLTAIQDIDKVKNYLRELTQQELEKRGISKIVHISGEDAMKM